MHKKSEIQWVQGLFDKSRILGRDGNLVASTGTKRPTTEDHANAAFIVQAVNSHAALVESVKDWIEYMENNGGTEDNSSYTKAKAAIALVSIGKGD